MPKKYHLPSVSVEGVRVGGGVWGLVLTAGNENDVNEENTKDGDILFQTSIYLLPLCTHEQDTTNQV